MTTMQSLGAGQSESPPCQSESDSEVSPPSTPVPYPGAPEVRLERMVPPAAIPSTGNAELVGLPNPWSDGAFRPLEDTFPKGPIGEVLKSRP